MRTLIIPAAGHNLRMKEYYFPKCLLPVHQRPILFRIIHSWKKFIDQVIIVVNKQNHEMIKEYMDKYFTLTNISVEYCVQTRNGGTYFAVKLALEKAKNDQVILNWSDVCLTKPSKLNAFMDIEEKNLIFTTDKVRCRWKFDDQKFIQDESYISLDDGIFGVFVMNKVNGTFLKNISEKDKEVEILEAMDSSSCLKIDFEDFEDIGDPKKYGLNVRGAQQNVRAFGSHSKIYQNKSFVIKKNSDPKLQVNEINWYKNSNFSFTPKVYSYEPLILQKLPAAPIAEKLTEANEVFETEVISNLFDIVQEIHNFKEPVDAKNDDSYEQYIGKTIKRLEKINFLFKEFNQSSFKINGILCKNPLTLLKEKEEDIKSQFTREFRFIHGDLQTSNVLIDNNKSLYVIDPRGYFGNNRLYGDPAYDFAKMYYGFCGGYHTFSKGNNQFIIQNGGFEILPLIPKTIVERRRKTYMKLLKNINYNNITERKIDLLHAIIWISVAEYTSNDVLSAMYAYLKGTLLLNQYFGGLK